MPIFTFDNFDVILNPPNQRLAMLHNSYLIAIVLFSGLFLLTPYYLQDASAKIFGVSIPEGSGDPKKPFHYLPSEWTVTVGDTIQWSNFDTITHTVTSGSFQGGPDGLFNSGLLEGGEIFRYQVTEEDIGQLSYYCTLHPWMNGIITVSDPEGEAVGEITEVGSLQSAEAYVDQASQLMSEAQQFADSSEPKEAAVAYSNSAHQYHLAALQFALLEDHEKAALYHHEAANQHHNAALQNELAEDFGKAVSEHFEAGVHHHFASVQYGILNDQKNMGKHLSESLRHKGMAKFGSDYILPPKHQVRFLVDVNDISCKNGLDLVLKSTTKEPACIKPSSAAKLIERGWAIRAS